MNTKLKRKTIILTILGIAVFIFAFVAISFSFLRPVFNEGRTHATIGNGTDSIIINYTDCAGSQDSASCSKIEQNLIPGDTVTKTFELSNTGREDGSGISVYFKQYFNSYTTASGSGSELSYKIDEVDSSGTLVANLVADTQMPYTDNKTAYNLQVLNNLSLDAGETRYFKITFTFINYPESYQDYNKEAKFSVILGINSNGGMFDEDTSGANAPNLVTNMIPIIYDETLEEWVKASTTQVGWYNYDEQVWANAATISQAMRGYYNSAEVGTIVSMDDIIGMWVWIPRYAYRIVGTYGSGGNTTSGAPGAINIEFLSGTSSNVSQGYIMHPSFVDGSKTENTINGIDYSNYVLGGWDSEITGFWYGKFETANDSSVKPNMVSWRNINVSTMYNNSLDIASLNNISLDSHMSKNDEWGAVAYLSQSIYGKYGNNMYTGANKEVYINNYSGYYTGVSSGAPSTGTSNTVTCYYNDLENRGSGLGSCGGGASTTGNIYGVYDMSGGDIEYTMGYLNGYLWSSGWNTTTNLFDLNNKYYNAYTAASATTACNGGICYGHALSETAGWYGDYHDMISASGPWFYRGGYYGNNGGTGVFDFLYTGGGAAMSTGFRVVLT